MVPIKNLDIYIYICAMFARCCFIDYSSTLHTLEIFVG